MRIAVCDDEAVFRRQLVGYLEQAIKRLSLKIDEFASGEALLMEYEKGTIYDLIFLDIEMKKVDAFRFLQKPVQEEKLLRALRELWGRKREENTIVIHTREGDVLLKRNEIVYIESIRNDLYIHTIKKREYRTRRNMKELVMELEPFGFFQCHRSYLINMEYLLSYDSKSVLLEYELALPMSRGKNKELREVFMKRFWELV